MVGAICGCVFVFCVSHLSRSLESHPAWPGTIQGWSSLSLSGLLSGVNSQISKSPSDQSVHSVRAWEHSDPRVLWVLLSCCSVPWQGWPELSPVTSSRGKESLKACCSPGKCTFCIHPGRENPAGVTLSLHKGTEAPGVCWLWLQS